MESLARDGWRTYLAGISIDDGIALLKYLAEAGGRKPQPFRFACASSVRDNENRLVTHP